LDGTDLWMPFKLLHSLKDTPHKAIGSIRIIKRNAIGNLIKILKRRVSTRTKLTRGAPWSGAFGFS
jgi:hypothetical protein